MKRLILPLAVILSLASCTVTEDLSLSGNGGTSYADIHVEDFFIDVLNDFSTFIPESSETIMDSAVRTFSEQLDAIESVTSVSWEKTGYSYLFSSMDDSIIVHLTADGRNFLPYLRDRITYPEFGVVYDGDYYKPLPFSQYIHPETIPKAPPPPQRTSSTSCPPAYGTGPLRTDSPAATPTTPARTISRHSAPP